MLTMFQRQFVCLTDKIHVKCTIQIAEIHWQVYRAETRITATNFGMLNIFYCGYNSIIMPDITLWPSCVSLMQHAEIYYQTTTDLVKSYSSCAYRT